MKSGYFIFCSIAIVLAGPLASSISTTPLTDDGSDSGNPATAWVDIVTTSGNARLHGRSESWGFRCLLQNAKNANITVFRWLVNKQVTMHWRHQRYEAIGDSLFVNSLAALDALIECVVIFTINGNGYVRSKTLRSRAPPVPKLIAIDRIATTPSLVRHGQKVVDMLCYMAVDADFIAFYRVDRTAPGADNRQHIYGKAAYDPASLRGRVEVNPSAGLLRFYNITTSDSGEYVCCAKHFAAEESSCKEFNLKVEGAPSAPRNVQIELAEQLIISWTPPSVQGKFPIDKFHIKLTVTNIVGGQPQSRLLPREITPTYRSACSSTTCSRVLKMVKRRNPNMVAIAARVAAHNDAGIGPYSDLVTTSLLQKRPEKAATVWIAPRKVSSSVVMATVWLANDLHPHLTKQVDLSLFSQSNSQQCRVATKRVPFLDLYTHRFENLPQTCTWTHATATIVQSGRPTAIKATNAVKMASAQTRDWTMAVLVLNFRGPSCPRRDLFKRRAIDMASLAGLNCNSTREGDFNQIKPLVTVVGCPGESCDVEGRVAFPFILSRNSTASSFAQCVRARANLYAPPCPGVRLTQLSVFDTSTRQFV